MTREELIEGIRDEWERNPSISGTGSLAASAIATILAAVDAEFDVHEVVQYGRHGVSSRPRYAEEVRAAIAKWRTK